MRLTRAFCLTVAALACVVAAACRDTVAPVNLIPQAGGGSRFRATVAGFPDHPAESSLEGGVALCRVNEKYHWLWCELKDTLSRSEHGPDHDRTVVLNTSAFPAAGSYAIDTVRGGLPSQHNPADFYAMTWALSAKERTIFGSTGGSVTILSASATRITGVFDVAFMEPYSKGDTTPWQRMHVSGSFDAPVVPDAP